MLYNLNTRKHGSHTGNSNGNTSSDVRQAPINLAGIRTYCGPGAPCVNSY